MSNKRIMGLTLVAVLSAVSVLSATSAFATNTTTTTTNQERPQKPENEIIGKITAIDANSVTIAVATRKEMQKPADGQQGGTPPEKPANGGTNSATGNPPEKPNMDNMFTLTSETKTINIASAKFDGGHMEKPKEFGSTTNATNTTNTTAETQKAKTYADYAVGDYVSIEMTDATSLVAKTVRDAGMGGGPKGFNGQQPPQKQQ